MKNNLLISYVYNTFNSTKTGAYIMLTKNKRINKSLIKKNCIKVREIIKYICTPRNCK